MPPQEIFFKATNERSRERERHGWQRSARLKMGKVASYAAGSFFLLCFLQKLPRNEENRVEMTRCFPHSELRWENRRRLKPKQLWIEWNDFPWRGSFFPSDNRATIPQHLLLFRKGTFSTDPTTVKTFGSTDHHPPLSYLPLDLVSFMVFFSEISDFPRQKCFRGKNSERIDL